MKSLVELSNIGKVLAENLEKVGIRDYDDLVNLGSIETFIRLKQIEPCSCYNCLYAIEGAIQKTRWHNIPKKERESLKKEYLKLIGEYK